MAEELPNAIWANQFDNIVNRQAHYETTGPEIWRDTDGKVDAFVCATGTGGTLAGASGKGSEALGIGTAIGIEHDHARGRIVA